MKSQAKLKKFMKPIKLKIETKTQKYPIIIGSNLITNISNIIKDNSITFNQCLLVVDKNVPKKFITKIKNSLKKNKINICFFSASETNKSFGIINKILEIFISTGHRSDIIANYCKNKIKSDSDKLLNLFN